MKLEDLNDLEADQLLNVAFDHYVFMRKTCGCRVCECLKKIELNPQRNEDASARMDLFTTK